MKTSFSFLLTVLFSSLVFAQRPATILSFSPQGTTKEPHQVRAEFSEDIVNFGDPRGPMPFDGNCVKKGSGRWIDTRNWVFDFKSPLVGGEKCRFVLKDIKTLKGNTFAAASIFNFDTGGPSIVATQPNEWDGISEDQVFILFLDAVPQLESVKAKAHFVVKGIGDKIPVRIMDQAVAEPLLREASKNRYRAGQHLEIIKGKLVIKKPVLVIQAARAFPKKGEVSLVWDKGTLAASGAATPSRQISEFKIKEGFKVQFSCEREAPEKPCVPIASISVTFSEPVENEMAMKVQLKGPGGKVVKPSGGETKSKKATVYSVEFKPPFEMSAQYEVVLPAGFKNDIGDKPINLNRFPLKFKTSDAPALLKFAADFGIIEMSPEAALPVTLRNLEETIATSIRGEKIPLSGNVMKLDESRAIDIPRWLSKVSRDSVSADSLFSGSDKLDVKKISIKKPAGAKAFEVVGIPFSKPGFYVVEMESKKIGETLGGIDGGKNRTFIRSAALVTKMAVHAKRSHDQALVWVTDLQSTAPVADAQVIAFSCDGKTIASGKTDSKGLVTLTGKFEENLAKSCNELFEGYSSYGQGVYFVAAKGDDRSFTHSSWDQGIENWRFQLGYYDGQDSVNVIAHTVLDRSLFKPREKVHMRHVVRVGTQKGFELLKDSDLPKAIKLVHSSGEQEFEVPVKWNAKAGIADLTWDIPENARMGSWSISFTSGERTYHTGSFQVEQFRIPILRARVQGPDKPAVRVSSVPITVGVEYLAGGPASDLAINLQWQTEDRGVIVADEDYAGFAYLNGSPTLGINRVKSTIDEKKTISGNQSAKLDGAGALTAEIKDLPVTSTPKNLRIEAAYKDPSGETKVASRVVPLWPSDRIVGIRHKGWYATKKVVNFEAVVMDLKQQPVDGAQVKIDLYKSDYYTHRKKLLGGFYSYEDFTEVTKISEFCSGKTSKNGILSCKGVSPVAGDVIGVVTHVDGQSKEVKANAGVWVVDPDNRWWGGTEDHDRADLIPSKKYFEPGEMAEFQLRTPFEESKVLLTIEREGVFESQIVDVKGDNPILKVKIKPEWSPNVFVSAFAIRGRIPGAKTTSMLDLGKPAFRLGLSEIKVGWKAHTLTINAQTDKKTYKVREKGVVKIKAATSEGKPASNAQAVVAIVDEGLLELKDNATWDLLTKMMRSRELGVRTSTNQMQVIGKRTFGLKAVASGGGGGGMNGGARELFDSLLLWQTVELDRKGEAQVPFTVNDSLTSFKVAVVAIQDASKFGTGYSTFNTTQDFMIFAGISPVIRARDLVFSEFTIRNVTSGSRELELALSVEGLKEKLPAQKIKLQGNESKEVSYKISVPQQANTLGYDLLVKNEKGETVDRIKKSQMVTPVIPIRVYQASLSQLEAPMTVPVEIPKGTAGLEGGVQVSVGSTLLSSLGPLESFMRAYRFNCLEQRTSKAIALRDEATWKKIAELLPEYLDNTGLAKYFPEMRHGDVGLTTYLLAVTNEAGYGIPDASIRMMTTGLQAFLEGRISESPYYRWPDATLRKISAMEALSRYKSFNTSYLQTVIIQPELWPTTTVVDFYRLLQRESSIPKRDTFLKSVESILRGRLQFQGTRMQFANEKMEDMWWSMTSGDVTAIKMVLATLSEPNWKTDAPKLMIGAIRRQKQGAWDLTTANAWGRLSLEKFATKFEKEKITGEINASLKDQKWTHAWSKGNKAETLLAWPKGTEKLQVEQKGTGKPWVTISSIAALPLQKPLFAGYRVDRTIKPIKQKKSGEWSRGDLARITLDIEAQSSMSWVVIEDPVPAGVTILGSDLGGDSQLDVKSEKKDDDYWASNLSYEERSFTHYRAYYAWLDKGKIKLEYTIRLNQAGEFQIPATRVEAMYEPDLFGELVPTKWVIKE